MSFGKNISKNVSSKYIKNIFWSCIKQTATDALKTDFKKRIQKPVAVTGDLTENKIADRTTKVPETSQPNNSEEQIEHDREIHRE